MADRLARKAGRQATKKARTRDGWKPAVRSLSGLLTIIQRAANAEFHRRMDAAGYADIRPGAGSVFEHLGPNGTTIAAMAKRAGITPQALVQVVDELERKGYVKREPSPTDRRAKLVRKTARGNRMTADAARILQEMEAAYAEAMGAKQFAAMRASLEQLSDLVEPG